MSLNSEMWVTPNQIRANGRWTCNVSEKSTFLVVNRDDFGGCHHSITRIILTDINLYTRFLLSPGSGKEMPFSLAWPRLISLTYALDPPPAPPPATSLGTRLFKCSVLLSHTYDTLDARIRSHCSRLPFVSPSHTNLVGQSRT